MGGAADECFPPALRFEIAADGSVTDIPVTLLGPDLREEADGRQLGLAKIVAGLTGLAPDDIFRRAERARKRTNRIRAGIAASLVVLAGAGGYLYWRTLEQGQVIGSQTRVIADSQKREAEIREIVSRELARRPGGAAASPNQQQDLAAAVRSLLAQADDGDATAARIAELLRQGKTDEAIDIQVAAAEARERRATADAKRAARDYREAAALASAANPARARDLYARAARLDPDDVEGLFQHGWAQQVAGALGEAEAGYRRLLSFAKPGRHDLRIAWAHYGLGDIQSARGRLNDALAEYRRGGDIADRLAKADPGNAGWQRDLSVSYEKVGNVLVAQGQLPDALKAFRDSLAIFDSLAKADPGNAGWQRDLAISFGRVAEVDERLGEKVQALEDYRRGREIIARLKQQSPSNALLPRDLEWFDGQIAELEK